MTETVPFLRDLAESVQSSRQIPSGWFPTAEAVLDALGVGLGPGLERLFRTSEPADEFERWAVERGRSLGPARIGLANDLASGGSPSGERARLREATEAAPPVLSAEALAHFGEHGYVVLPEAASVEACSELAAAIHAELGAVPGDPASWYEATLTQGLMVPLHQAPGIAEIHASLRIRRAFAELLGTSDLVMSADRCGFNAPLRPGESWKGPRLHLDLERYETPIPLGVQGILYLTDTAADQGALRVVPGFHKRIDGWIGSLPGGADPTLEDLEPFGPEPVAGPAGSLVIWHKALPHGPAPNTASVPRVVHYLTMYEAPAPVDLLVEH
jgi:ectoine hydroxylase-related dioxygenase (phytanoyl-CoA dioxygenase family)